MILRGALYSLAVLFSLLTAGRFAVVQDRLARLLSAFSVAWAVNAATLLALLVYSEVTGDPDPSWRGGLLTVNAAFMVAAPLLLYVLFPGEKQP
jgi:hypothetical protein